LFVKTLENNLGSYDYYVIMPHFKKDDLSHVSYTEKIIDAINQIPKDKLIIMDNAKPFIEGTYGSIYQDFQEDIYNALKEGLERLRKYDKILLVYPTNSVHPYPKRILQ